jgi:CTP:molybdopterin cytidylyltransferase MocA
LFGRAVFGELLAVSGSEGAKAVVRADSGRVVEVPVSDPAVVDSINTPDAYRNLIGGDEATGG